MGAVKGKAIPFQVNYKEQLADASAPLLVDVNEPDEMDNVGVTKTNSPKDQAKAILQKANELFVAADERGNTIDVGITCSANLAQTEQIYNQHKNNKSGASVVNGVNQAAVIAEIKKIIDIHTSPAVQIVDGIDNELLSNLDPNLFDNFKIIPITTMRYSAEGTIAVDDEKITESVNHAKDFVERGNQLLLWQNEDQNFKNDNGDFFAIDGGVSSDLLSLGQRKQLIIDPLLDLVDQEDLPEAVKAKRKSSKASLADPENLPPLPSAPPPQAVEQPLPPLPDIPQSEEDPPLPPLPAETETPKPPEFSVADYLEKFNALLVEANFNVPEENAKAESNFVTELKAFNSKPEFNNEKFKDDQAAIDKFAKTITTKLEKTETTSQVTLSVKGKAVAQIQFAENGDITFSFKKGSGLTLQQQYLFQAQFFAKLWCDTLGHTNYPEFHATEIGKESKSDAQQAEHKKAYDDAFGVYFNRGINMKNRPGWMDKPQDQAPEDTESNGEEPSAYVSPGMSPR